MRATILIVAGLLALGAANEKKVVCYYASWAIYRSGNGLFDTTNIDPSLCTHLIYAFIGLNEDGTVKVLDPIADLPDDNGNDGFNKFIDLRRKHPDTKYMVGLGGWNQGSITYSKVVGDPALREKLVASVIDFLKKYRFDGLDFDWEYPTQRGGGPADKENFNLMLKELREAFDKERGRLILSAAVAASPMRAAVCYDIPELVKHVHFLNLMTYDFHGPWDKKTGMNAPLYPASWEQGNDKFLNVYESVKFWTDQGAPNTKIVMGIPFYGKSYTLTNPKVKGIGAPASTPGVPGPYTREAGTLGYNEICEMMSQSKYESFFDGNQQVPYLVKGNQWISYDSAWSIQRKVELINKYNLGGAMVWSIDTDDFKGNCGLNFRLLKVIKHIMD